DISKWKELEEELTRQAFHDPLTSLPNRELFIDRLEHALGRGRRHAKGVAVLFLDLDDFKTVNDSLGHAEGDNLIRQVAGRLAGTVSPGDLANRSVIRMEALGRWSHPERGLLPPAEFIPLAEHSGLSVPLGSLVLKEACRQGRAWQEARPDRPTGVSVNLSPIQLQDSGLVAAVSLALEESELPPELLTLEMTESVMASDDAHILRRLRQLKG